MLLNAEIIKLAFITQNNHVYEYTAESPTLKVLLNVRSPYRRQKRDLSIIRSLFRRPYWNRNTCNHTDYLIFLPTTSTTLLSFYDWLFLIYYFLPSCDYIDHSLFFTFLRSHRLFLTFLPTISTIFYFLPFCDHIDYFLLFTFLRSHRLFPIFLSFCDYIDYFLPFCFLAAISTTYYRHIYRWSLEDNPYSLSQSNPR
jgi:hypothetical protein